MLKMNKKKGASLGFDKIKIKKEDSSVFWEPASSVFSSPLSQRLKGELIVYQCSGVRRCCHHCCCCQPFSDMNISEASRSIAIKFYLKHHWGGGKAAWVWWRSIQNSGFHGNRQLPYSYNEKNGVITFS